MFYTYAAAFSLPARLAFGLFMVALAYPVKNWQSLIPVTSSFYLCSALSAGTAMAVQNYRVAAMIKSTVRAQDSGTGWWIVATGNNLRDPISHLPVVVVD